MESASKREEAVELNAHYYNPKNEGSYSGLSGLKRGLKGRISSKKLKNWLSGEDAYTLHVPVRRKFRRRKTIVSGIGEQWQGDLVDVSSLKKYNRGNTFILTVVDCFSRVAYAVPLKNKTSKSVISGLKSVIKKAGGVVRRFQSDKGIEFGNRGVQDFLSSQGIEHFTTENDDVKGSIVERFNCTLKEKLWRYFTQHKTLKYVSVLPDILASYNKTYHRSIGMAPLEVNLENQETVWKRL